MDIKPDPDNECTIIKLEPPEMFLDVENFNSQDEYLVFGTSPDTLSDIEIESVEVKTEPDPPQSFKKIEPFPCEKCSDSFLTNSALKVHVLMEHADDRPFKCELCGDTSITRFDFRCHYALTHPDLKVQCVVCNKLFADRLAYRSHMYERHIAKRFQCRECTEWFQSLDDLITHMKGHYKCVTCDVQFSQKRFYVKHCLELHRGDAEDSKTEIVTPDVLEPRDADTSAPTPLTLKKEANDSESEEVNAVGVIKTEALETSAVFGEENEVPFECKECPEKYSSLLELNMHLKCHSKVKPLECGICPMWYYSDVALNRHIFNVHGIHLLQCEVCFKPFNSQTNLNFHIATHVAEDIKLDRGANRDLTSQNETSVASSSNSEKIREESGDVEKCIDLKTCSRTVKSEDIETFLSLQTEIEIKTELEVPDFVEVIKIEPVQIKRGRKPNNFECKHCRKTFCTKSEREEHTSSTHTPREFKCFLCDKLFFNILKLNFHLRNKHLSVYNVSKDKDLKSRVACPHCCEIFTKAAMVVHLLQEHDEENPHECIKCNKRFPTRDNFNKHACPASFKSPEKVPSAKLESTALRSMLQIKCPKCDESFEDNSAYKHHAAMSQCCECKQWFKTTAARNLHAKQHSRNNKVPVTYVCGKCPMWYYTMARLARHMAQVHEIEVIRCEFCATFCPSERDLENHYSTEHAVTQRTRQARLNREERRRDGARGFWLREIKNVPEEIKSEPSEIEDASAPAKKRKKRGREKKTPS